MATMKSGLGGPADYGENVFSSTSKYSGDNDDGNVEIDITSVFSGGINFFGTTYSEIYVSANGLITFGDSFDNDNDDGFSVIDLPGLAPYFSDMDVDQGGEIYWDFDTINGKITITWDAVEPYNYSKDSSDDDGAANSFQIVLTDLGGGDMKVEYIYADIQDAFVGGDHAIAGLTDGSGQIYELEGSGNDSFMESNYATNDFGAGDPPGTFSFRTVNGTPDVFAVDGTSGDDLMRLGYTDFDGDEITSGDDIIYGYGGNDTLYGEGGADYIDGGTGRDFLFGGQGNDTLSGGDGNDLINGQDGDDYIEGGAGFDNLYGNAGNDTILGGIGTDYIFGGTGVDSLDGGDDADRFYIENDFGNDTIIGGEGGSDFDTIDLSPLTGAVTVTFTGDEAGMITDGRGNTITFSQIEQVIATKQADFVDARANSADMSIDLGDGDDTLYGGFGADSLQGGDGNDWIDSWGSQDDTVDGGAGSDTLEGGAGNDLLIGGAGNDSLTGWTGDDTLRGGAGNDTLHSDVGNDLLDGGDDSDTFIVNADGAGETIIGGEGGIDDDVIDLSGLPVPVTVTYSDDEAGKITAGGDTVTFTQIEHLILTDYNDNVDGSLADSIDIVAGAGDDTIIGGDTTISVGDSIDGGAGNDSISGMWGADTILGGDGDDTIDGGDQGDSIDGGAGNDLIEAGEENGIGDNDIIHGGTGNDTITSIETGAQSNDSLFGDDGDDVISVMGGDENLLSGGTGNDTLTGGTGSDTLDGGTGDDSLTGGGGDDVFTFTMGDGSDTITDFNTGNTGALGDGDTTNNDFIDLSSFYDNLSELRADFDDDGVLNQSNDGTGEADYSDNSRMASGDQITFQQADRQSFTADNTGVVCFTTGTAIRTPKGDVLIDELQVGDLVCTLDNGPQPIAWIGKRGLTNSELSAEPTLRPVLIKKGVLGAERNLFVSRQHGMLINDSNLARAIHLADNFPGVRIAQGKRNVTYIHLMFDSHQILFAENIPSESFFPGPEGLKMMTFQEFQRLLLAFPQLDNVGSLEAANERYGELARPFLKRKEVEQMCKGVENKGYLVAKELKKWDADLAMERFEVRRLVQTSSEGIRKING